MKKISKTLGVILMALLISMAGCGTSTISSDTSSKTEKQHELLQKRMDARSRY